MPCKIRVSKINLNDEEFVSLILSFTATPATAIIVKEHTPADHYHCYLDDCFTPPTIRSRLADVCPTKNNDSYSVSTTHNDWKLYKGYLLKYDGTTILHCKEDVEDLRKYYESKSPKKARVYTEYSRMFNYVSLNVCDKPTAKDIAKSVMSFYHQEQKIFHKAHIAQIVNTIYHQIYPEDESFLNSVLEESNIRQQNLSKKVTTKSISYFHDPE